MNLEEVYQPIADDLEAVEDFLRSSISESKNPSILAMNDFLLESQGKRIRPALVLLSERAASEGGKRTCDDRQLIEIATAVELIHMASLIHDDVLDKATMRHNRPSINTQYGDDISIVLGDYIYSKAFQLIGNCRNPDIFMCISEAIYSMCEGELIHISQRGNLDLSKDSYIVIAKKKTASLFAACCHTGTIVGNHSRDVQRALKEFGLNFGVAFQIIDDCKDFLSEESELGKRPGQDLTVGDVTLPMLILSEVIDQTEKEELRNMFGSEANGNNLTRLRAILNNSNALSKIHEVVRSYLITAKKRLDSLANSVYKESLNQLVDCTVR
jgi:octaprenyl-diphosphate synthase